MGDFVYQEWWRDSDLFFFGYASVEEAIRETASRLSTFMERVLGEPRALLEDQESRQTIGGGRPQPYAELVLVAHSQGGLIVRQAILDALWDVLRGERQPNDVECLIESSQVRLFAPAIWGARLAGLTGLALATAGPGTVAKMMLGFSPSYKEMQQGSTLLTSLQRSTEAASLRYQHTGALRARIAWAERDLVVIPGHQYDCDPKAIFLPHTDHRSVVKSPREDCDFLQFVRTGAVGASH